MNGAASNASSARRISTARDSFDLVFYTPDLVLLFSLTGKYSTLQRSWQLPFVLEPRCILFSSSPLQGGLGTRIACASLYLSVPSLPHSAFLDASIHTCFLCSGRDLLLCLASCLTKAWDLY